MISMDVSVAFRTFDSMGDMPLGRKENQWADNDNGNYEYANEWNEDGFATC